MRKKGQTHDKLLVSQQKLPKFWKIKFSRKKSSIFFPSTRNSSYGMAQNELDYLWFFDRSEDWLRTPDACFSPWTTNFSMVKRKQFLNAGGFHGDAIRSVIFCAVFLELHSVNASNILHQCNAKQTNMTNVWKKHLPCLPYLNQLVVNIGRPELPHWLKESFCSKSVLFPVAEILWLEKWGVACLTKDLRMEDCFAECHVNDFWRHAKGIEKPMMFFAPQFRMVAVIEFSHWTWQPNTNQIYRRLWITIFVVFGLICALCLNSLVWLKKQRVSVWRSHFQIMGCKLSYIMLQCPPFTLVKSSVLLLNLHLWQRWCIPFMIMKPFVDFEQTCHECLLNGWMIRWMYIFIYIYTKNRMKRGIYYAYIYIYK